MFTVKCLYDMVVMCIDLKVLNFFCCRRTILFFCLSPYAICEYYSLNKLSKENIKISTHRKKTVQNYYTRLGDQEAVKMVLFWYTENDL